MLAIIAALKDWRHFLEGLPGTFEIWSNHKNLTYWKEPQNLSRRQARWAVTNLLILYLLFVTCHTLNGAQHVFSTAYRRSVPRVLQYLFRLWPDVLIEHLYYAFLDCIDLNRSR